MTAKQIKGQIMRADARCESCDKPARWRMELLGYTWLACAVCKKNLETVWNRETTRVSGK